MTRALALVLACVACGTNRPDIPPELLQATGSGGGNGHYPAGPYAANFKTNVGKPVPNLRFAQGWLDPLAVNQDLSQLAPIELADFYDPEGTKGNELLLSTPRPSGAAPARASTAAPRVSRR